MKELPDAMKKIRKLRVLLFSAAVFVSILLNSVPASARVVRSRITKGYSTNPKYKSSPESLRIAFIGLCIVFIIFLILMGYKTVRWIMDRSSVGSNNKKYGKKYAYKLKAPKDISEKAAKKIQKNDPAFSVTEFLLFAENTTKRIVMASSRHDTEFLKETECSTLFEKHHRLLREGNILSAQDDIKSISANIMTITEYYTHNKTEEITVYLKCSVSRNSVQTKLDTPCDIVLTFKRKIGTKSSSFTDGICASCGADISPDLPRCPQCGGIAKFNTNGWELSDFDDLTY